MPVPLAATLDRSGAAARSGGEDAVAAAFLGPVKRRVGAADQLFAGLLAVPEDDPGRAGLAGRRRGAQAFDEDVASSMSQPGSASANSSPP